MPFLQKTGLTILLLIDAFRPDYLRDAPYLRRLAASGASGRLREPFGFAPRPAYFGGLRPEQSGQTHMYVCDPQRSPFAAAAAIPSMSPAVLDHVGVREFLDRRARLQVTPYARTYASTAEIPVALLPHLTLAEQRAPWDPRVGYRSLFHELDGRAMPWFACAWPESNRLDDPSDHGILNAALASIQPWHRFAYIHLQELDQLGHACGPDSATVRAAVHNSDALVERLVETLQPRVRTLNLIVFGDHGMVSVVRTIDVRPILAATGLVPGIDYVYFLDSTMARFWFLTSRSREPLTVAMRRGEGLNLVTPEQRRHLAIDGLHSRNGEAIYLADPGVVICPNFFQDGLTPPRGMHGYAPDVEDNQGVFIATGEGIPAGDAGVVDAAEIFRWCRGSLGLEHHPPVSAAPRRLRFTQQGAEADEAIGRLLDQVCDAIERKVGRPHAIVLTGSFGRGEGAVLEGGPLSLVNDLDIIVVADRDCSAELATLARELRPMVGSDFLDLAWTDGDWASLPPTMANFDLKYGSQVLRGDETIVERLPVFAPSDLPVDEGLTLLLNRTAGVLSGLCDSVFTGGTLTIDQRRYLTNQVVKALVAIGDWHLVNWGAYDSSYRIRGRRFGDLARGARLDSVLIDAVSTGYRRKMRPVYQDPTGEIGRLSRALVCHVGLASAAAVGEPVHCAESAAVAYIAADHGSWIEADNRRLAQRPAILRIARSGLGERVSLRRVLYASLPLILRAAYAGPGSVTHAVSVLGAAYTVSVPETPTWKDWNDVRGAVVDAWFEMIR